MGGHLAARLLASGQAEVSVLARGPHLAAIQTQGLRLNLAGQVYQGRPCVATDNSDRLEPQDLVIVALKAQALPGAAPAIARLLKSDGLALFLLNGIPWWWNYGLLGERGSLELLDPQGDLWRLLRQRTLGCVCHASNEVIAPGVIEGSPGDRWLLGDPLIKPQDSASQRLLGVLALLKQAGFAASASTDLRRDIWHKLLINASLNPVSALTRLPTRELTSNNALRDQMMALMREVVAVAKACGWDLEAQGLASPSVFEAWLDPAKRTPTHRTSMLQDVLAGRSLEVDALLGQTQLFARDTGVATPVCDVLLPLLRALTPAKFQPLL